MCVVALLTGNTVDLVEDCLNCLVFYGLVSFRGDWFVLFACVSVAF